MSETLDIENAAPIEQPALAKAISQLKRELKKVAKSVKDPAVLVSAESLPKIAAALDPSGRLYPSPTGNYIKYNGVCLIARESGWEGIRAALEEHWNRMEYPIDF